MPETTVPATHPAGFSPRDALMRAIHRWWVVVLAAVVGGVVGLVVEAARPPQYEAGFRITVGIEQTIAGELTQYEEDVLLEAVGGILYAPAQLEAVARRATELGFPMTAEVLKQNSTVERRLATWLVRLRAPDAKTAEAIASAWMELSQADIVRAYASAQTADGLSRYLDSLVACLSRAVTELPAFGICTQADLPILQAELERTGAAAAEARLAARGMSTSLLIDPAQMDLAPARRVALLRGELALAGGMIGFVVGIWLAQATWPGVLRRGRRD